jgi:hypothetical protein
MNTRRLCWVALAVVFVVLAISGCSSIYLKHPGTGDVVECDPVWWAPLPAQAISRESCRERWKDKGYEVVEKCKHAPAGVPCVTEEERDRAH